MHRDGDRLLQLLIFNEEYLVGACHQRASITSLPFVHTARRSYRLNDPVRPPDCDNLDGSPSEMLREAVQTLSFRGRRSRNKVSVGEPAEGSLSFLHRTLSTVCRLVSDGLRRKTLSVRAHPASADTSVCGRRLCARLHTVPRVVAWPRALRRARDYQITQLLSMDILA